MDKKMRKAMDAVFKELSAMPREEFIKEMEACDEGIFTAEMFEPVPFSGGVIFEAVDRTDEDMYFTVGLWPTLEEAIKAFDNSNDPDEFSNDVCHEEYCLIEIRERKIGWSDTGIERAKLEWTSSYNEEDGGYIWARKI
ncbi:MAG: hypothetical protein KAR20_06860 [Candidatus Heimdallarchaeota archaeon]|nr:hypothetical protein [Candidatus Heimdallarchaeota archaeon]